MKILDLTNNLIFNILEANYIDNNIYHCYANTCAKIKKWYEDNKDKELDLIVGTNKFKGKIVEINNLTKWKLSSNESAVSSIYIIKMSNYVFKLDDVQVRQYQREIILKNLS